MTTKHTQTPEKVIWDSSQKPVGGPKTGPVPTTKIGYLRTVFQPFWVFLVVLTPSKYVKIVQKTPEMIPKHLKTI
jgi:hypothetical protein